MAKHRIHNPPIFLALLRQYDSPALWQMSRRFWFQDRPWAPTPTRRFSEVVDGRFTTPNKHSDDL